ncbi:MAG: metallophosphatase family protein [Candidatus Bathyarchaeota archaeon]|nr:metallophosphatase family protein [Candidatus Bathyarchaeota archaeon]
MLNGQARVRSNLPHAEKATTFGLISDTHVPSRARCIPQTVFEVFENVDYIIHAGDIVELSVIDELEQLAPVIAVHGNMDGPQVSGALPKLNSLEIMDWKIGVIHDPGAFSGMRKLRELAKQNSFNIFVYGHTHTARIQKEGPTLYINPGSPTNPQPPFLTKPTVGMLRLTPTTVTPEIIQL